MINGMPTPRLSIVIPTYNHAHFLRAALDSIRAQTLSDWEAVVINNFSEDDTVAVVESYDDPRIRLVSFANHGIIAAARNHGLSLTQAPFVAFLDSDDFWYPEKLQRCMDKLAEGYDLVCHAEVWVGSGERRRTVHYGPETRATYESLLLDGNCLSTSAVVVRREWVERAGGFSVQPEFVTAEDYELWLKLARDGAKIGFVDEILGEYLIHEGNQSRAALRNMQAVMAVFENHRTALEGRTSARRMHRREAVILYSGARGLQDSGQHRQAWPLFFKAVMRYPWVPRFYVAMLLNALGRRP
ncbi:glycosyltransferase [uncultured Propionivibrio sp.]|uniref:glycosyltransferase family 2 protein n=1 Tax=uncultured Propionivibrio sp. TaxID=426737 RepID=UPI0029C08E22|nr:glycosyltransferase [uncultured Propionivibrio sp.]